MDVYKYASPADETHDGACTALIEAYERIQADDPRKMLSRVTEPYLRDHLEACSSLAIIQRVSAESRAWARDVRKAIEGGRLTAERLTGLRSEVQQILWDLAQDNGKVGKPGGNRKKRKLKAKLKVANKTIGQLVKSKAQLAADDAQKALRIAELEADKHQQDEKITRLEAYIASLKANLAEQAKGIEALPQPKPAKPAKKSEAQVWKPNYGFRRDAERYMEYVTLGAELLGQAHGLTKDGPLFRAPDLWKAMQAERLINATQKNKTLDLYAGEVLRDLGYSMPAGRPAEIAVLCGVEFLRGCYKTGLEGVGSERGNTQVTSSPETSVNRSLGAIPKSSLGY